MFEMNLYEDYICPKCGRCSELCNCDEDESDYNENEIMED